MKTKTILDFMTFDEAEAYAFAASLSAACEPDRAAWQAGVEAIASAKARAIAEYVGAVKLNRHGQPFGGTHPATVNLGGCHNLDGCWAEGGVA